MRLKIYKNNVQTLKKMASELKIKEERKIANAEIHFKSVSPTLCTVQEREIKVAAPTNITYTSGGGHKRQKAPMAPGTE